MELLADGWAGLVVMAALLAFSAVFSSSETAFFSLTRPQLRRLRDDDSGLAALVVRLRDAPRLLLISILFGNLAVNIGYFALAADLSDRAAAAGRPTTAVLTGVFSLLLFILLAEFLPKGVALHAPVRVARAFALPVWLFSQAILPVRLVLDVFVRSLTRLLAGKGGDPGSLTARELKAFVRLSGAGGGVEADESDMMEDVIDLGSIRLKEVLVPRVDMVAVGIDEGRDRLLERAREERVSKVVVVEETRDRVRGWVSVKDALYHPERPLEALVREILAVPETKTAESLLREFRETGEPLALVVDEYGGTAGIVTPEDLLEEIVGEISDEYDEEGGPVQRIAPGIQMVAGELTIREWEERTGVELPRGAYDTVGGYVTAALDRIPGPGDTVEADGVRFRVVRVEGGRVLAVLADGFRGRA